MTTPLHRASLLPSIRARQSAATLAAAMLVVAAVVTFLSLAAYMTSQFGRYAGRQQTVDMRAAYCDAAMENAFGVWRKMLNDKFVKGTMEVTGQTLDDAWNSGSTPAKTDFKNSTFPYAQQLGIDPDSLNVTIQAVDQNGLNDYTMVTNATTQPIAPSPYTPNKGLSPKIQTSNVPNYPGWIGYTRNYLATVSVNSVGYGMAKRTATGTTKDGDTYQVRRYFQVIYLPLCQNLGFFQNVMEIHPGAPMILNGKIHSNKDIYAQGYGAYLQFLNNISYVGAFNDGTSNPAVTKGWDGGNSGPNNPDGYSTTYPNLYKDGLPKKSTPGAKAFPANTINPIDGKPVDPSSGTTSAYATQANQVSAIDPFGGRSTNQNGLHDVVEAPATPTANNVAYNNASLFIEVNSANLSALTKLIPAASITIKVVDGTGTLQPASSTDYANVLAAINSGAVAQVWDKRENATAMITNLDMGLLDKATTMPSDPSKATALQLAFNQSKNSDGTWSQNGTVYIHDKAAKTTSTRPSIRLTNGRNLGENVSVASDNGVYILGDYNTGGSVYTDVPTNKTGTDRKDVPQTSDYNRYASSVMADAVTILSNNWNDKNAGDTLSTRTAVPTTVNVAILAGDVGSNTYKDGVASGGLHNFPRFLENWNGVNFTYYGSLIEAFNSEQFTGEWKTGDVYHWPNRLWSFDTKFLTTQPPGLPQGIVFTRGRWERFFGDKGNG